MLAMSVRRERQTVKQGTELIPWLTNGATGGTGGAQTDMPFTAMYNMLIQLWANGATGFNMYTDYVRAVPNHTPRCVFLLILSCSPE